MCCNLGMYTYDYRGLFIKEQDRDMISFIESVSYIHEGIFHLIFLLRGLDVKFEKQRTRGLRNFNIEH